MWYDDVRLRRQQCLNFVRHINKRDRKSNVSYKKAWDLLFAFFVSFPFSVANDGKKRSILYQSHSIRVVCGQFPLKKSQQTTTSMHTHWKVYVIFLRNNSSCESMRFIELVAKFLMFFLPLHQQQWWAGWWWSGQMQCRQ